MADDGEECCMDQEAASEAPPGQTLPVYVVTDAYRKKNKNELGLHVGDHVTQLLVANETGMAYGEVTRGIFNSKKRGFYPVGCVKPARKALQPNFLVNKSGNPWEHPGNQIMDTGSPSLRKHKWFSKANILKKVYGVEVEVEKAKPRHNEEKTSSKTQVEESVG
ncbi:hypothetical protein MAR_020506, partial [Mya arenaria]